MTRFCLLLHLRLLGWPQRAQAGSQETQESWVLFKAMHAQCGAQFQKNGKDSPGGSWDPKPEQLDCEMEVVSP